MALIAKGINIQERTLPGREGTKPDAPFDCIKHTAPTTTENGMGSCTAFFFEPKDDISTTFPFGQKPHAIEESVAFSFDLDKE